MMWNDSFGHGVGWEGWLMFILMIAFVVAIIVAVVFLVRSLASAQATPMQAVPAQPACMPAPSALPSVEAPQDILKRRYAAGEIERQEYLQKLGDL